jgi:malate/lactate dehydrogenase
VCDELVLVDIRTEWAIGQALDVAQSIAFSSDCVVRAAPHEECAGSDIIVISAGKARSPEIKSRLDLAGVNAAVMRQICPVIQKHAPNAIIVTITNPMDAINYLVWNLTGFERQRVVGSGGMLDSSRARWLLGQGKSTSVDFTVLGEHGDGQTPMFSRATKDGKPLNLPLEEKQKIYEALRLSSMEVVSRKEATVFAPASGTVSMIQAILQDKKEMMPCSAVLQGEYGLEGLSIGVPVILGRRGIEKIEEWPMDEFEKQRFAAGAKALQDMCSKIMAMPIPPAA